MHLRDDTDDQLRAKLKHYRAIRRTWLTGSRHASNGEEWRAHVRHVRRWIRKVVREQRRRGIRK